MMSSVLCSDILALKMMMIIIIIIIIPRVLLSTLDNTIIIIIIIIIIMSAERGRERERGYTTCRGKEIKEGVGAKAQKVTYTKPSTRGGRVGKRPSHIWALKHHRVMESLEKVMSYFPWR